jgi:hypothetical protein
LMKRAPERDRRAALRERVLSTRIGGCIRALRRTVSLRLRNRARMRATALLYGPSTVLAPMKFPPGHYHSPIPSQRDITYSRLHDPCPSSLPAIDLNLDGQLELLESVKPFYEEQPFTLHPNPRTRYHFTNDVYPCADAIVLYCLLRRFGPQRLIEIGSGWSTCVTLDTAEHFLAGPIELTLIEPYPDRLLTLVRPGDLDAADLRAEQLQDVPVSLFESLQKDDVLFIDSTHVSKTGSDVNYLMFEILPRLAAGVHVHIHDVHYPFEYPEGWVQEGWGWNETFLVRAFLQYNHAFTVEFFTDMLRKREAQRLAIDFPLLLESPGASDPRFSPPGSLWLCKNE